MPESNSIYDIYAGAGKAMGEYEASWSRVGDVWEDISFTGKRTEQRQEQRESTADTLMAAIETGSTLVGGHLERKKFKEQSLPGMQNIAAEESYMKGAGREKGALSFEKFVGTEKGKEFYSKFKPKTVGMTGKSWEDSSFWEKLGQEKMYQFGEDKVAYTLGKADITGIMEGSKYGLSSNLSGFQKDLVPELAEIDTGGDEVTGGGDVGEGRLSLPTKDRGSELEVLENLQSGGKESVTLSRSGGETTEVDPETAKRMLKDSDIWSLKKQGGSGAFYGSKEYEGAFGESQNMFKEVGQFGFKGL